jgi:hypothetical protein
MNRLNLSAPYGVYIEKSDRFYGQGNNLYDMRTLEFVRCADSPVSAPTSSPSSSPASTKPKAEKMTCNECGKEFALPAEPKARRLALGKLRAHLSKAHGITLEKKT